MSNLGGLTQGEHVKEVVTRLDRLIRIVALTGMREMSMTEKIMALSKCGFKPSEIADLVGTTSNVVNVRLSELRRRGAIRRTK